jgi:hypothetical protein
LGTSFLYSRVGVGSCGFRDLINLFVTTARIRVVSHLTIGNKANSYFLFSFLSPRTSTGNSATSHPYVWPTSGYIRTHFAELIFRTSELHLRTSDNYYRSSDILPSYFRTLMFYLLIGNNKEDVSEYSFISKGGYRDCTRKKGTNWKSL